MAWVTFPLLGGRFAPIESHSEDRDGQAVGHLITRGSSGPQRAWLLRRRERLSRSHAGGLARLAKSAVGPNWYPVSAPTLTSRRATDPGVHTIGRVERTKEVAQDRLRFI